MTSSLGKWTSTENKAVSTFVENDGPVKSGQIGPHLSECTLIESPLETPFSDSKNAAVSRSALLMPSTLAVKTSEQQRRNLILSPSYKKGACDDREGEGRPSNVGGVPDGHGSVSASGPISREPVFKFRQVLQSVLTLKQGVN